MNSSLDVAIVGAGPYGMSIAAHLKDSDVNWRIFGRPMQTWSEHMPSGMSLKSDGFASNLSDPLGAFTLAHYCNDHKIEYDDRLVPVSLATFVEYGLDFQRRLLPNLDQHDVVRIDRGGDGLSFVLTTSGGETVTARRVVLAIGIRDFAYRPHELESLPPELVSHSSQHKDLDAFKGQSVSILGSGASAVDFAALLSEKGAKVCMISRRKRIEFHDPPSPGHRSLRQRLRNPSTGLGPGWKSWAYCNVPQAFRLLPSSRRQRIVQHHLGPAGGWAMKNRLGAEVEILQGVSQWTADREGSRLRIRMNGEGGTTRSHTTSHLIAATGYRADLRRLRFLGDGLRSQIAENQNVPILKANFESSVPGLYFVGLASAGSFGPMMRFAFGSGFTAKRLSAHLQRA